MPYYSCKWLGVNCVDVGDPGIDEECCRLSLSVFFTRVAAIPKILQCLPWMSTQHKHSNGNSLIQDRGKILILVWQFILQFIMHFSVYPRSWADTADWCSTVRHIFLWNIVRVGLIIVKIYLPAIKLVVDRPTQFCSHRCRFDVS